MQATPEVATFCSGAPQAAPSLRPLPCFPLQGKANVLGAHLAPCTPRARAARCRGGSAGNQPLPAGAWQHPTPQGPRALFIFAQEIKQLSAIPCRGWTAGARPNPSSPAVAATSQHLPAPPGFSLWADAPARAASGSYAPGSCLGEIIGPQGQQPHGAHSAGPRGSGLHPRVVGCTHPLCIRSQG